MRRERECVRINLAEGMRLDANLRENEVVGDLYGKRGERAIPKFKNRGEKTCFCPAIFSLS